ncbi:MAG TPA: hypothetical protein VMZ71_06215, partial [Gemmataceae bacterium]|nr:hypothetical protein [Gemmataceae bacterium]
GPGRAELTVLTAAGTKAGDGLCRAYGWDLVGREVVPFGGASGVQFQLGAPAVSPAGGAVAFPGRGVESYAGGKWDSWRLAGDTWCSAVAFGPGGEYLAAGGGDGVIRVFGVGSPKPRRKWTAHARAVSVLVVSPDGKRLASAGADGGIGLWNFATGDRVRAWEAGAVPATYIGFLPGGAVGGFPSASIIVSYSCVRRMTDVPVVEARRPGSLPSLGPSPARVGPKSERTERP